MCLSNNFIIKLLYLFIVFLIILNCNKICKNINSENLTCLQRLELDIIEVD